MVWGDQDTQLLAQHRKSNQVGVSDTINVKVNLSDIQKKGLKVISDPKLLLVVFCIVVNVLNVGLLWENTYLCFGIATVLLLIIWSQDYREYGIKRLSFLITSVLVAFGGPFLENIMIYLSKDKCWVYGNVFPPLKVSLDLIPGYGIMGSAIILLYKVLEKFLKK